MGQFKPMVKMMTTEPTVELKLKKGGAVTMKKGGSAKVVKKVDGGALSAMSPVARAAIPAAAQDALARAPMRPALAARRRAMAPGRLMKEGGETAMEHEAEMKEMKGVKKELKSHESKPASKAHKGLATGGVVKGQGGFKKGGKVAKKAAGGIITVEEGARDAGEYRQTKMHSATPDKSPAKTGGVKLGNAGGYKTGGVAMGQGGYKKGGAAKKYAKGGSVNDSGKAEGMPQGRKKPSTPVSINQLSGTFKDGGKVMTPAQSKLQKIHEEENAPAMKAAKADTNLAYSRFQKLTKGGKC